MRPPLLLTGHLVIAGHAAPWEGKEGQLQQRIGVENACDLARRFLDRSIDVVLSDVLNHETAALCRDLLPGVLIVQLRLPLAEARRRATLRPMYLTEDEFDALHALHAKDMAADHTLDVELMSLAEQTDAVAQLWQP
jgi:hypothetical protein